MKHSLLDFTEKNHLQTKHLPSKILRTNGKELFSIIALELSFVKKLSLRKLIFSFPGASVYCLFLLLSSALLLNGCGKKGTLATPKDSTFPRTYPSY
jgi:hypothetical protein